MERTPSRRQAATFTRRSLSASSQRTMRPDTRHSPENPEFGSRRIPGSGAMLPAEARQTMALPSANAIATPLAPVIASARSATSCSTSSRTNCSSCQSSSGPGRPPSRICFARRVRICSCRAEKASRACKASWPRASVGEGEGVRSARAGTSTASSLINSKPALFRLALMGMAKNAHRDHQS